MEPPSNNSLQSEIKLCLNDIFQRDLPNFSIEIAGGSEKGDGYIGDIVFVNIHGKQNGSTKTYNLVLKCSKQNQALQDAMPIKDHFLNEIYFYEQIYPQFVKFQRDRRLKTIFDSVPTCYGTFSGENIHIVVLQNLKPKGYSLFDRKKQLSFDHLSLVLTEYGKYHAVSVAMQDQEPETFKALTDDMVDIWEKFVIMTDMVKLFTTPVDDALTIFQDEPHAEHILNGLETLRKQIPQIIDLRKVKGQISIMSHGDCWINNFMFKHRPDGKPERVAILDWQIMKLWNPVCDLSYFIYVGASEPELKRLDDLLTIYYTSFCKHLTSLGSDPSKIFTFEQLMADWKIFGKIGLMMSMVLFKICLSEKDEVVDIAQGAEAGKDMGEIFNVIIKDTTTLKHRIRTIFEHVIERNLL